MENDKSNLYNLWLKNVNRKDLLLLKKIPNNQINNLFGKDIVFGTAGIREQLGLGTSKINQYVIARFAYCFGLTLFERKEKTDQGVIIFHDNRMFGKEFSLKAARILSALKIPVYLYHKNEAAPTPFLSHLIMKNNCVGGINITASHNTKEYSGMKFYDNFGKQINQDFIKVFQEKLNSNHEYFNYEENDDYINYLSSDTLDNYANDLLKGTNNFDKKNPYFKVVFNSNHGASIKLAKILLKKLGYSYEIVKEQEKIDSNFTNSQNPNPQAEESFKFSKIYGDKINATILVGADPDADRIGVMVKHKGKWILLNGNQVPIIQSIYNLKKYTNKNQNMKNLFAVRSIVTSNYLDDIFAKYGIKIYSTLTGFSWIANKAFEIIENNPSYEPFLLWEESNGAILDFKISSDKDFFQNFISILQISYDLKVNENKTLIDYLEDIQVYNGYFHTYLRTISLSEENKDLYEKLAHRINQFFKTHIFLSYKVKEVINYRKGYKDIPKKDVIEILFENGSNVFIRNSGTEPILKVYINIKNKDKERIKNHKKLIDNMLDSILK